MRNFKMKAIWPNSTGAEYYATEVYAWKGGKVLYIGKANDVSVVTVQCNKNECLRYCNLKTVNVKLGQVIQEDALIGTAHSFTKVEYCTSWQDQSHTCVRTYNKIYYIQDIRPIYNGTYYLEVYVDPTVISEPGSVVKLSDLQMKEFENNRGDNIVEFNASNIYN